MKFNYTIHYNCKLISINYIETKNAPLTVFYKLPYRCLSKNYKTWSHYDNNKKIPLTLATPTSSPSWFLSRAYSSAIVSQASCESLGFIRRAMCMNFRINFVLNTWSFFVRVRPWSRGSYFSYIDSDVSCVEKLNIIILFQLNSFGRYMYGAASHQLAVNATIVDSNSTYWNLFSFPRSSKNTKCGVEFGHLTVNTQCLKN